MMETINHKIRNKLTPLKNIIALIEKYENATNGEDKRKTIEFIINSKALLQKSLDELLEIE
ncbi:hypothetical protein [Bacteroides sp. 224]|uniref:hypothetical protein n=1 Tax=Bacteroides sp. 224 TaxID=2302936 RepID=UPI0013D8D63E|nr:hypothetical protein [Bacteroides sp. 224]